MKKKITLLFFAGLLTFCCNAQNIIQISNDGSRNNNQQKEKEYKINGISASSDIGGVDATIIYEDQRTYALFTNYNSFPVTVLYEIGESSGTDAGYYTADGTTGTIVLGESGSNNVSKKIKLDAAINGFGYPINRSNNYSIRGLIVRKLSR